MRDLPSPATVISALGRPLPAAQRRGPLRDTAADPGVFGPGSVTWRVMREPLLMLGAGRALLMQAAHPLVAQGALDHSGFARDPYGRLERTVEWVTLVCFGTTEEARRACARVARVHQGVAGRLPAEHATDRVAPRTPYTADDAALLRWVHASFVDAMLTAHDALVGGLSAADRDAFVSEWDAVAGLMDVPRRLLWRDAGELRDYVDRQVRRGAAHPGAGSRRVAATILHPPVRSPLLRPGMDLLAFISVGLLPSTVRRAYGIRWTPAHAASHAAWLRTIRALHPALPRRLRISPIYDVALRRARGQLSERSAA